MRSLIDLLEKIPADDYSRAPGRYDSRRGLRVDSEGRPIVEKLSSATTGTGTRGGRDRDDGIQSIKDFGTITKASRDRDHLLSSVVTKTGAGRDADELSSPDGLSTPFGNFAQK
jgi:hypothetical protein